METTHRSSHSEPGGRASAGTSPNGSRRDGADDRPLGQLLKEIRDEAAQLFRQEVELARAEIGEKISRTTHNLAYLIGGGLAAFAGLIVLLTAAGEGVAALLVAAGLESSGPWLGPLLVGVVVIAIGITVIQVSKSRLQKESFIPRKTAESIKENKQWVLRKAK